MKKIALLTTALLFNIALNAQTKSKGQEYPDGHAGVVYFPAGDISFADEVVSFEEGNPKTKNEKCRNTTNILGIPDIDPKEENECLTLGCGGTITLKFTNNSLTDIDGPDLYVFEIGDAIEPTSLSISVDGITWIEVGKISGGRADVDIAGFAKPGEYYSYVRLTDLKSNCGTESDGADIDAVAAIGSGVQIKLNSAVLFDVNKYELKPKALDELNSVIAKINEFEDAEVTIEGHTDSDGTDASNQILSENRAKAVKIYFSGKGLNENSIATLGFGESRPVAENSTEEGKQQNRRVLVDVKPKMTQKKYTYNALFMVYNKTLDCCVKTYPRSINEETFPGLWKDGIDDALNNRDGKIYFFKKDEFLIYSTETKKIESSTPQKINEETWSGLWTDGIDAAMSYNKEKACFIKDDQCMMYNLEKKKPMPGYPKKISRVFTGIWEDGIDAAVYWPSNNKIYFFKDKEYIRYDVEDDKADNGYPKPVQGYWCGFFPENITALVNFEGDNWFLFKAK